MISTQILRDLRWERDRSAVGKRKILGDLRWEERDSHAEGKEIGASSRRIHEHSANALRSQNADSRAQNATWDSIQLDLNKRD